MVTEIATFKVRECYIKFPVTMPPSKGFLHTMCERVRGKGQSAPSRQHPLQTTEVGTTATPLPSAPSWLLFRSLGTPSKSCYHLSAGPGSGDVVLAAHQQQHGHCHVSTPLQRSSGDSTPQVD